MDETSESTSPCTYVCQDCGIELPISNFYLRPNGTPRRECKMCHYEHMRRNIDKRREADPKLAWAQIAIGGARGRAKAAKIPFAITVAHITALAVDVCPVLRVPLQYPAQGKVKVSRYSPSLDRIIPALGYIEGNIIVVSMLANRIKNDASPDEIRAVADFYSRLLST